LVLIEERLLINPMQLADIAEVRAIELEVFPTPWPSNAYQRELNSNRSAHYFCLWRSSSIAAYGGLWSVGEEAHITTIGVRRSEQGKGFGRAMFMASGVLHGQRRGRHGDVVGPDSRARLQGEVP